MNRGLSFLISLSALLCAVVAPAAAAEARREIALTVTSVGVVPGGPAPNVRVALRLLEDGRPIGAPACAGARLDGSCATTGAATTDGSGNVRLSVSESDWASGTPLIEVQGAGDLAIAQPPGGQVSGRPAVVEVELAPKGSALLLGPAQIRALLNRYERQVFRLERMYRTEAARTAPRGDDAARLKNGAMRPRSDRGPDTLAGYLRSWAAANGFAYAHVEELVRSWAEDALRRGNEVEAQDRYLADLARRDLDAALGEASGAKAAAKRELESDRGAGDEGRAAKLRAYLDWASSEAGVRRRTLDFGQATETLAEAQRVAAAELAGSPQDAALRHLWLDAAGRAASALVDEGSEEGARARSEELLARALDLFQQLSKAWTDAGERQEWAAAQVGVGKALGAEASWSKGQESARLLARAVEAYRGALAVRTKDAMPREWAETQNDLGRALRYQGERSVGAESARLLAESVVALRGALEVRTKEAMPQDWAETQYNLGVVLGEHESGAQPAWNPAESIGTEPTRYSAESADAFRRALEVWTMDAQPEDWATTQWLFGGALLKQAEGGAGADSDRLLAEAVVALRSALTVWTKEVRPDVWAMAQADLGIALAEQAKRTSPAESARLLAESAGALRGALEVLKKDTQPALWADAQQSLGITLSLQGRRASGPESARLLGAAASAFRSSLEVLTKDAQPQTWAMAQFQLGGALSTQAEWTAGEDSARLTAEAVVAFRRVQEVWTKNAEPHQWAMVQAAISGLLRQLAAEASGAESARLFAEAAATCRSTLEVWTQDAWPEEWAWEQREIGRALEAQADRTAGAESARLRAEAVAAYRSALKVWTKDSKPDEWATTQERLGAALGGEATRATGAESARLWMEAGLAFASALDVRTKEANPRKWAANHYNIGNSLVELAEFAQASGVGTARMLAQAVASFRHALEVLTKDAEPVWWAQAQGRLGTALGMEALLAKGDDAAQLWSEAAVAARHALEVWTEDGNRQNWVAAQNLLRIALRQQESQRPPTPGRRAPAGARRR